jgi:flavin reductase (DIM6/NTAB) family NADH-FMN oxidoreductase RutF
MHFRPDREDHGLPFNPFKSCTVPRPIGWLSSVSPEGVCNLAPYSQWQNLTFDPPLVMFAANQTADGRRKDTVVNAERTGSFVWNMATWDLREAVNRSSMSVAPEVDEFELAGVEKADAVWPVSKPDSRAKARSCRSLAGRRLPVRFRRAFLSGVG